MSSDYGKTDDDLAKCIANWLPVLYIGVSSRDPLQVAQWMVLSQTKITLKRLLTFMQIGDVGWTGTNPSPWTVLRKVDMLKELPACL